MDPVVEPLYRPNARAMLEHVTHLFGGFIPGCHDGLIELAWTATAPDEKGRYALSGAQMYGTDQLEELVEHATKRNSISMCSVYVGAALRHPQTPLTKRTRDEHAWALTGVYTDLDDDRAALDAYKIYGANKPTLVVITGTTPWTRAQLWWRLDEPLIDTNWSPQLLAIAASLGGDPSVANKGRLMRLAGSIAWPHKEGRITELTAIQQLREPGPAVYMPEHVALLWPPESFLTTPVKNDFTQTTVPGDEDALGFRPEKIVDGRERYMLATVMACLIECIARNKTLPSVQELFDAAWPQYERHVDLSRPGRGPAEMLEKCRYAIERFSQGRIPGMKTVEDAVKAWRKKQAAWNAAPAGAREARNGPAVAAGPAGPAADLKVMPAFPIDPSTIPTRPWLVPGLLIRNHVTVFVAPPGVGKSLLTLQIALAGAAGMAWGGWTPRGVLRTLLINAEDDLDEMRRRLVAAVTIMGISQAAVTDQIFLTDTPDSIVIARTDPRTKAVFRTPLVDTIVEVVRRQKIDLVVVDPFAESFEGDENSNSELKWTAALWREIARKTGSCVLLVHHTRKYASGMSGDADAARGAGALVGVARVVSTLFHMTQEEAELFGVEADERHRYIRFDSAKANLSLITGEAKWFLKLGQDVGNSNGLQDSDESGVLVPWSPPGLLAGASVYDINRILGLINVGILDEDARPSGSLWSPSRRSTKRWAGTIVCDVLGCDGERAAKILKTWLASGLLYEVDYDDNKQTRKGLKVDFDKRPGDVT